MLITAKNTILLCSLRQVCVFPRPADAEARPTVEFPIVSHVYEYGGNVREVRLVVLKQSVSYKSDATNQNS